MTVSEASYKSSDYKFCKIKRTTYVIRLKLFRLKAEGARKAQLPYFGGM